MQRTEKTTLKRSRTRRASSTRWLQRQLNDPYVQEAQRAGWRARSVFKLEEIDTRFKLIGKGEAVVDLGAAPGSWSQYAAAKGARVLALDLLPVAPIAGVEIIQGDFLDAAIQARLLERLGGKVRTVLSDIAPDATGRRLVDRLRAEAVGETVIDFATQVLAPGGQALIKLVKGAEARVLDRARPHFAKLRLIRPKATRSDSSETYLLASGFRPPEPEPDQPAA
ncbi:MAG: RlmE family RNA methyltransferase [Geminicoccaceae bacterium]